MLPELSARLTNALTQKRRKEKLERDLKAVEAELKEFTTRLKALQAKLSKEKVDVERLERTSLTALFYTMLGSRQEQWEKERQELLAAQLQYQQVKHQVHTLQRDQHDLRHQLSDLAGVDEHYETLLAEKETLLRQTDQGIARELMEIDAQRANLASQINEVAESIHAGRSALSSLEEVLDSLSGAQSWGIWDMFGGGLLSTALKHDRIDQAREHIQVVQEKLNRFKRELADVQGATELDIEIGSFETFADYFFDGLIVDWVVQSKIEASLERARNAKVEISRALQKLQHLNQDLQIRQDEYQARRALLIERS